MSSFPNQKPAQAHGNPVGNGSYVVKDGDCLESIAFAHGLLWQNILNAPQNAGLKAAREANVLLPGDRLFLPQITQKSVDCATDKQHIFERKGLSSRIRLHVLEWVLSVTGAQDPSQSGSENEESDANPSPMAQLRPRKNVPYVLQIDQSLFSGNADEEGWIDHPISPGARGGSLTLEPGTPRAQKMPIVMGRLDPIDARSGVRQRLANLGFDLGSGDPASEEYRGAITLFQQACGIKATGAVDDDTIEKLKGLHGS